MILNPFTTPVYLKKIKIDDDFSTSIFNKILSINGDSWTQLSLIFLKNNYEDEQEELQENKELDLKLILNLLLQLNNIKQLNNDSKINYFHIEKNITNTINRYLNNLKISNIKSYFELNKMFYEIKNNVFNINSIDEFYINIIKNKFYKETQNNINVRKVLLEKNLKSIANKTRTRNSSVNKIKKYHNLKTINLDVNKQKYNIFENNSKKSINFKSSYIYSKFRNKNIITEHLFNDYMDVKQIKSNKLFYNQVINRFVINKKSIFEKKTIFDSKNKIDGLNNEIERNLNNKYLNIIYNGGIKLIEKNSFQNKILKKSINKLYKINNRIVEINQIQNYIKMFSKNILLNYKIENKNLLNKNVYDYNNMHLDFYNTPNLKEAYYLKNIKNTVDTYNKQYFNDIKNIIKHYSNNDSMNLFKKMQNDYLNNNKTSKNLYKNNNSVNNNYYSQLKQNSNGYYLDNIQKNYDNKLDINNNNYFDSKTNTVNDYIDQYVNNTKKSSSIIFDTINQIVKLYYGNFKLIEKKSFQNKILKKSINEVQKISNIIAKTNQIQKHIKALSEKAILNNKTENNNFSNKNVYETNNSNFDFYNKINLKENYYIKNIRNAVVTYNKYHFINLEKLIENYYKNNIKKTNTTFFETINQRQKYIKVFLDKKILNNRIKDNNLVNNLSNKNIYEYNNKLNFYNKINLKQVHYLDNIKDTVITYNKYHFDSLKKLIENYYKNNINFDFNENVSMIRIRGLNEKENSLEKITSKSYYNKIKRNDNISYLINILNSYNHNGTISTFKNTQDIYLNNIKAGRILYENNNKSVNNNYYNKISKKNNSNGYYLDNIKNDNSNISIFKSIINNYLNMPIVNRGLNKKSNTLENNIQKSYYNKVEANENEYYLNNNEKIMNIHNVNNSKNRKSTINILEDILTNYFSNKKQNTKNNYNNSNKSINKYFTDVINLANSNKIIKNNLIKYFSDKILNENFNINNNIINYNANNKIVKSSDNKFITNFTNQLIKLHGVFRKVNNSQNDYENINKIYDNKHKKEEKNINYKYINLFSNKKINNLGFANKNNLVKKNVTNYFSNMNAITDLAHNYYLNNINSIIKSPSTYKHDDNFSVVKNKNINNKLVKNDIVKSNNIINQNLAYRLFKGHITTDIYRSENNKLMKNIFIKNISNEYEKVIMLKKMNFNEIKNKNNLFRVMDKRIRINGNEIDNEVMNLNNEKIIQNRLDKKDFNKEKISEQYEIDVNIKHKKQKQSSNINDDAKELYENNKSYLNEGNINNMITETVEKVVSKQLSLKEDTVQPEEEKIDYITKKVLLNIEKTLNYEKRKRGLI